MPTEITDEQIAELRRLHEAATPGPWTRKWSGVVGADAVRDSICSHGRGGNADEWISEGDRNMDLIAAMHSALPALLSRLERAEKDARESYLRGKTDGANEEHSLNWRRENERIATLEAALREAVELIDNASERIAASRLAAALRGLEGK